jgi:hypothetical protein
MAAAFTPRQGDYLAFIERFTARHGLAPSFEEIGLHFGTTAPSVNGMIKTLVSRGLLSRVPGVARSLRVVVPASALTPGDYGPRTRRRTAKGTEGDALTATDAAITVAFAVLDSLMPLLAATRDSAGLVEETARAAGAALGAAGLPSEEVQVVFARLVAEHARWQPDGRGTILRKRRWVRRGGPAS